MNFVLSPDEEKEPSSLSFPSLMPSAPSLLSALSPALSGAGSQSPFLSSLARSPAQQTFIPGQSPSQLSLPGVPGQPSLLSPTSLSTPPPVLNQSPRTPILPIVSTQSSTKTLNSSSPTSSEETSLLKPFTTKLVTSQPAVSKSSSRIDKTDKKISNLQTVSDFSKGTNKAKPLLSPDKSSTDKLKSSLSDEGVKMSKVGQSSQSHSTSPINSRSTKLKASPSLSTSIKLPLTSLSTKPSTPETIKSISPTIKSLNTKVPDSKTVAKKGVVPPLSALSTSSGATVLTPSIARTSATASTSSTPGVGGGRQSRPPIPILKISTPLAKAGKRRAFKHYEDQGFQLEDFEEFTDTNDADFVEPKNKGKGRGRPKKQASNIQAQVGVPKPAFIPLDKPEKKVLDACAHFSNKEDEDEESSDSKFLSRSLSSIKHRLKSLGKDMSTPIKDSSKKVDSPFTLKIKRDVQGKWKMDSTPKNERLILKISSAKKKTPALKIKPIERNCVSEKPISLKISLKGRSRSPQVVESTPTSRFVPEGWVSFDHVQTNILPKLKEEIQVDNAPKPVSPVPSKPVPSVPSHPVPSVPSEPVPAIPSKPVPSVPSEPVPSVSSKPVSSLPCKTEEEETFVIKPDDKQDVKGNSIIIILHSFILPLDFFSCF